MSVTETGERRSDLKAKVLEQLHDPIRLRITVLGSILLVGYFAVYNPLNGQITDLTKRLNRDEKQLALAIRLEKLEKEYGEFKDRIPQNTDSKEWVQYLLDGIRKYPLRLLRFDSRDPKRVGPYQAIIFKIELEGAFLDMDNFIRWIETNERLLRIDEISMAPSRSGKNQTVLRLTVLGLTS